MNRRHFIQVTAGCFALCSLLPAVAEEPKSAALLQTLPPDGSWVKYNASAKDKETQREFTLTWTCRSVGQAFHGGKQCRFIEMERASENDELPNITWRMLVPESEFGEGKDPVSKAVKRWVKQGTMEPEAVEIFELKEPFLAFLLAGPKQNLKLEEAKEKIQWQQGDLECSVVSGRNEIELVGQKLSITHRILRHQDAPFGLAGTQQELNVTFGGRMETMVIKMTLRDHGKDAKAKLPDLVP